MSHVYAVAAERVRDHEANGWPRTGATTQEALSVFFPIAMLRAPFPAEALEAE